MEGTSRVEKIDGKTMKTEGKISVVKQAELAKKAASTLASMSAEERTKALNAMAQFIDKSSQEILEANKKDLVAAEKLVADKKISQSMFDRLKLDGSKMNAIVNGIKQVASIPDQEPTVKSPPAGL